MFHASWCPLAFHMEEVPFFVKLLPSGLEIRRFHQVISKKDGTCNLWIFLVKKSSTFRKSFGHLAESTYLTSLGGLCWHGAQETGLHLDFAFIHPNTWCVYILPYYINIRTSNIRYNTYVARQFQARFLNMHFLWFLQGTFRWRQVL